MSDVITIPTGKIRLGCRNCDRDDMDLITAAQLRAAKKAGWQDVDRVQTFAQACRTYDDPADAPPGYSVLDWWTHLGICGEEAIRFADSEARTKAWLASPEGVAWAKEQGAKA